MGRLFTHEVIVPAGSQFTGTEFSVQPPTQRSILQLKELDLQMGTESKSFRIEKRAPDGSIRALIQQSTDNSGVPAVNTAESVILTGPDVEVLLEPGEQIQIVTTGATAEMRAKLYLEDVTFQ